MTRILNGRKMSSPELAHRYLKEKLGLSDYYGGNLDALWDELTSLGAPLSIVLINSRSLEKNLGDYGPRLLDTLKDAAKANPSLTIKVKKWHFL